jgi:hypothetical protein
VEKSVSLAHLATGSSGRKASALPLNVRSILYTCLWRSGLEEDCAVSRRTNPPQRFRQALILILPNAYQSKQNDKLEPAQSDDQVPMRACASQNKSIDHLCARIIPESIRFYFSRTCALVHMILMILCTLLPLFSLGKPLLTFCLHF